MLVCREHIPGIANMPFRVRCNEQGIENVRLHLWTENSLLQYGLLGTKKMKIVEMKRTMIVLFSLFALRFS